MVNKIVMYWIISNIKFNPKRFDIARRFHIVSLTLTALLII